MFLIHRDSFIKEFRTDKRKPKNNNLVGGKKW